MLAGKFAMCWSGDDVFPNLNGDLRDSEGMSFGYGDLSITSAAGLMKSQIPPPAVGVAGGVRDDGGSSIAPSRVSLGASFGASSLGESGGVGLCVKPSLRRSFGFAQRKYILLKSSPTESSGATVLARSSFSMSLWLA